MNKEELLQKIAEKWGLCTCIDAYKLRGLSAPDCAWHSGCVEEAMKEYAIAMCEEQKKACAEGSKIVLSDYGKKSDGSYGWNTRSVDYFAMDDGNNIKIDKQSILETKNVAE